MSRQPENTRADSILGAVCGLGLAAAAWTLASSPALIEPSCLLFLAAGVVTGLARATAGPNPNNSRALNTTA